MTREIHQALANEFIWEVDTFSSIVAWILGTMVNGLFTLCAIETNLTQTYVACHLINTSGVVATWIRRAVVDSGLAIVTRISIVTQTSITTEDV